MKKNLGNLIWILFLPIWLYSSNLCSIDAKVDKNELFVNQEATLTIKIKQIDNHTAMFFEFIEPKDGNIVLKLINKVEKKDKDQKRVVIFKYKLIPKKSTTIKLPITIKVKQASFASVNSFNTGSADELENLKTEDTLLKSSPIIIKVKNLKRDVLLIGDFNLTYKIDKTKAKAYEPIYASYDITGKGNHKKIKKLFSNIDGVDVFLDKRGELGFDYVFVADKNFTIPAIKISCYSPKEDRYYSLNVAKKDIIINKESRKNILDKYDNFPTSSYDINKLLPYLNAFLIFLAGYFSAKFQLFKRVKNKNYEDEFKIKLKNIKDEKELLQLLLSKDSNLYKNEIKNLEDMIYSGKKHSLKEIKERVSNL